MQDGYFHVIAEPVSTCVHEIFELRPGALAALGHEVVDPALAVLVAGIPVLHRRVVDLRVVQRHQLHHRRVQLILVAHRRRAAFQVAHVRALLGHNQRPLELPRLRRVDAEVRRQLHRAAHALRHIHKRSIAEHRRIQRRIEVVRVRHHRPQILLHQFRMLLHRLRKRAEDHARFGQLRLERRRHAHAVEHRIHRHVGQQLLLRQRNPQLLVRPQNLRIQLVQARSAASSASAPSSRRCSGNRSAGTSRSPTRLGVRLLRATPSAIRLQPPFQHELGLASSSRDQPDHVLISAPSEFDLPRSG